MLNQVLNALFTPPAQTDKAFAQFVAHAETANFLCTTIAL